MTATYTVTEPQPRLLVMADTAGGEWLWSAFGLARVIVVRGTGDESYLRRMLEEWVDAASG